MSSQSSAKAHPWDVLIRMYQAEITREQNYHPNLQTISSIQSKIQALSSATRPQLPKDQPLNPTCLICNQADGCQTVQLYCNHLYHSRCFENRLDNSGSCPKCGQNIVYVEEAMQVTLETVWLINYIGNMWNKGDKASPLGYWAFSGRLVLVFEPENRQRRCQATVRMKIVMLRSSFSLN